SRLYQLDRDFFGNGDSRGLRGMEVNVRTWRRAWTPIEVRAIGEHQIRNAAAALATLDVLEQESKLIFPASIGSSLARLRLPGRFEVFGRRPAVILEVAHNPASFRSMAETIRSILPEKHRGKRILLFAASRDKDWASMLEQVEGLFTEIVLTSYPSQARSLPAEEMLPVASRQAPLVRSHEPAIDAWQAILVKTKGQQTSLARPLDDVGTEMIGEDEDLLCVAGSFYLIAELLRRDVSSAVI
ncbi:hypothetical protein K2X85_14305, partial [bacterium]|nr:hypothetical protein [bacterium]